MLETHPCFRVKLTKTAPVSKDDLEFIHDVELLQPESGKPLRGSYHIDDATMTRFKMATRPDSRAESLTTASKHWQEDGKGEEGREEESSASP